MGRFWLLNQYPSSLTLEGGGFHIPPIAAPNPDSCIRSGRLPSFFLPLCIRSQDPLKALHGIIAVKE